MATDVENLALLSREEAAAVLGVSARSIDRLRGRGRLPAVQFTRRARVRYRLQDVTALLESELREPYPARSDELEWSS